MTKRSRVRRYFLANETILFIIHNFHEPYQMTPRRVRQRLIFRIHNQDQDPGCEFKLFTWNPAKIRFRAAEVLSANEALNHVKSFIRNIQDHEISPSRVFCRCC
jgi:hypothetical protein